MLNHVSTRERERDMQYALELIAKKIGTALRLPPEVQWVFVTATVSEAGSMSTNC